MLISGVLLKRSLIKAIARVGLKIRCRHYPASLRRGKEKKRKRSCMNLNKKHSKLTIKRIKH
jgi:hypothetical protein